MKFLTLNTHSLMEKNYEEKLGIFADVIASQKPNIVALQEVNQLQTGEVVTDAGFVPAVESVPVRSSNHAYRVAELLRSRGIKYSWTWLPVKTSYDKFDEGLAFLSLSPISKVDVVLMSNSSSYQNWKTRKALGIQTENKSLGWFYNVHMGWWDDAEEPFIKHWRRLCRHTEKLGRVWLMGDFNAPAEIEEEGYDVMMRAGWYDTFYLSKERDEGYTVNDEIDGWSEHEKMRIDYILCNRRENIKSSRVIFNGENAPIVSDHFGVIVER